MTHILFTALCVATGIFLFTYVLDDVLLKQSHRTAMLCAILAFALFTAAAHAETCTKYCNPERSRPCGNACVALGSSCHKPTTTACVGARTKKVSQNYTNPKHVEPSK